MASHTFWCWSTFLLWKLVCDLWKCWSFERAAAVYCWTVTVRVGPQICVKIRETHATGPRYQHIFTRNETKVFLAERFIQTLKSLLLKSMERRNSLHQLETLPQLTRSYNSSFHRSIRSTPDQIWDKTFIGLGLPVPSRKVKVKVTRECLPRKQSVYKYKIGDTLKINYLSGPFKRVHDGNWSCK